MGDKIDPERREGRNSISLYIALANAASMVFCAVVAIVRPASRWELLVGVVLNGILGALNWLIWLRSAKAKGEAIMTPEEVQDKAIHDLLVGAMLITRPRTQQELDAAQATGRALLTGGRVFIEDIHPPYRRFGVIFEKHTYCAVLLMDDRKCIRWPYEFVHEDP